MNLQNDTEMINFAHEYKSDGGGHGFLLFFNY